MQDSSFKDREELKNKMAEALNERIKSLSSGLQDILVDDLVTAFEIRFAVLRRAQSDVQVLVNVGLKVTQ